MEVTEVKVTLANSEDGRLKAFANIVLDGCFVVRGLKIIEGQQRTLVMMPSIKKKDGSHQDSAYPINRDLGQHIEDIVLDAYAQKTASAVAAPNYPERTRGADDFERQRPQSGEGEAGRPRHWKEEKQPGGGQIEMRRYPQGRYDGNRQRERGRNGNR